MTDTSGRTVLLVDDEPKLLDLYESFLQDTYEVITATCGTEGIAVSNDRDVDVAILDRRMPGLSGTEVLEELRNQDPSVKVLMLTAVEPDFDIVRMEFDTYLNKPVSQSELQSNIEELLALESFTSTVREYHALLRKEATLRQSKTTLELERNDTFENLEDKIADLEATVGKQIDPTDDETFVSSLRSVEAGGLDDG
jgi:DNA-binding response OmpR family regulator